MLTVSIGKLLLLYPAKRFKPIYQTDGQYCYKACSVTCVCSLISHTSAVRSFNVLVTVSTGPLACVWLNNHGSTPVILQNLWQFRQLDQVALVQDTVLPDSLEGGRDLVLLLFPKTSTLNRVCSFGIS